MSVTWMVKVLNVQKLHHIHVIHNEYYRSRLVCITVQSVTNVICDRLDYRHVKHISQKKRRKAGPCQSYSHYSLSPIYIQASTEVHTIVQVLIETWTPFHVRIQIQSTVYR